MSNRQSPTRISLLRCLCAALAFALCQASGTAFADNACVAKGGVGGTGYTPDGGVGGTGVPPEGGVGGTGSTINGGVGGTGTQSGGVGGTGSIAKGGVGGTGYIAKGGVGGTGKTGVGVVGTITGFASVCVNGLEVHYASSTPVMSNGLPASVADLAMGQVVTIEASGAGYQAAGELGGVRISILNAVAGPVASIDAVAKKIVVLGQTVRITAQTLIADPTGIKDFSFLGTGSLVRVSGLRLAGGEIVASRVDTVLSLDQASVLGPVTQSDAGGFSIYGLRVNYADITGIAPVTSGEVMVSGRLDGASLRPERITLTPSLSFAQDIDHLVLEGYIGTASSSEISVGGVKVALSTTTGIIGLGSGQPALQPDVRVQVSGHLLADHSMIADTVLLRRDPLAPPAAASIMPPPRGKILTFNRTGDGRVIDSNDATGTALAASRSANGGSGAATSTGSTTTTTTGGTSNTTSTGTLGGGSTTGVSGGGTITPGGGGTTTTKPATVTPPRISFPIAPRPHTFDAMDFRPLALPRVAH